MSKMNAVEGLSMVEATISNLEKEQRTGSRYFLIDPDEETLIPIEAINRNPEQMDLGGFLYRADFDENGDHTTTLLT